jgi:hypothetical protein
VGTELFRADGRADVTLIAFHNLANSPNVSSVSPCKINTQVKLRTLHSVVYTARCAEADISRTAGPTFH